MITAATVNATLRGNGGGNNFMHSTCRGCLTSLVAMDDEDFIESRFTETASLYLIKNNVKPCKTITF